MRPRRTEEEILADLLSSTSDDFITRNLARIRARQDRLASEALARVAARCPGLSLEGVGEAARREVSAPCRRPFDPPKGWDPWGPPEGRFVPHPLRRLAARLGWLETPLEALCEIAPDDEDAADLLAGLSRS